MQFEAKQSYSRHAGGFNHTAAILLLVLLLPFPSHAAPLDLLPAAPPPDPALRLKALPDTFPDFRMTPPPQVGVAAPGAISFWQEETPGTIDELMARQWVIADSPALMELARTLLLSTAPAPAPPDAIEPLPPANNITFWRVKLARLFDIGALDALDTLATRQPALLGDPGFALLRARMALADNQPLYACALVRGAAASPLLGLEDARQLPGLTALCEAQSGQLQSAELTLRLLEEQNYESPAFRAALDALIIRSPPAPWQNEARLDEKLWVLYQLAFALPPPASLAQAHPALLVALAQDENLPDALRHIAAKRAAARHALPARQLRGLMGCDEAGPANATETQVPLRRLRQQLGQADSVSYLAHVYACRRMVQQIEPDESLQWFALDALQALLLLGHREKLAGWLRLIPSAEPRRNDGDAGLRLLLDRLVPPQDQILPLNPEEEQNERARRTLLRNALMQGFFSEQLPSAPRGSELAQLLESARAGRRGETALRVLLALSAQGGPHQAPPDLLQGSMQALRRTGFAAIARELGVEALVLHVR